MALIKDTAIVLRRLDYSETSQVLVLLTREHGQLRIIAKGIKRSTRNRAAVGIDLLERGRIVFSLRSGKEDGLATLTEWHQEDNYAHLQRSLPRCYAAQYSAEVTSQLTEVLDPHPMLFDGLHRLLDALADEDVLVCLVDYLWLMLKEIGLQPELSRCVSCNGDVAGEPVLHFSSRQGGVICRDCEPAMVEKRRMRSEVAQGLVSGKREDDPAAFDLLDYHLREIMFRPAKLSSPLRAALKIKA
ncbi:MAG: DNA repair protein RecO [Phycisphaerales bacterium]|nr:DNA repair protein RecO [Phycisphaerales bacterium]